MAPGAVVAEEQTTAPSPAERRRQARITEILTVAWALARRDGLSAISLRELADRVNMRQPSLYNYFASKAALYDAMFAAGFQELVDERTQLGLDADPLTALRMGCRHFVEFCVHDAVRYQLLFQHSIPGFQPSPASMGIAERALAFLAAWLQDAGLPDPATLDLMRALLLGIAGEQIANEPGGQRWLRFTDDVVDIAIEQARGRNHQTAPANPTRPRSRKRA